MNISDVLKHIAVWLGVKLPIQFIGYIVLAIYLPFTLRDTRLFDAHDQRLPKLLRWFDNADDRDQKYGLNGDFGHRKRNLGVGDYLNPPKLNLFWMRYTWLAVRNPVNYLQRKVLGADAKIKHAAVDRRVDSKHFEALVDGKDVGDGPNNVEGTRTAQGEDRNGKKVWEYYLVKHYGNGKCLRIRIGYKLGLEPMDQPAGSVQWVCSISPWKTYRGV